MSDEEGRDRGLRNSVKSATRIALGVSSFLYQGLEVAIKNPKRKYQDKVSALLSGWERLASLSNASPGSVNNLAECLYRDTLTLVLKGHWPKLSPATKTHLSVTLQRCISSLLNHSALKKCRDLIGLVNNPWGHPTLTGILNNQEGIRDAEVLEFCLSEKESTLFMRLETLCDSKCEDLALKLAHACVRCLRFPDTRFHDECSEDERYYILDLYIFLLYKFKNVQEIINELKHLDLKEGLELIRRYSAAKNDNNLPRVWKNSHKVAELAAQYFLAVAMVKPVAETVDLLKDLMAEWIILHFREEIISENLANMIRKLIQPAESALHVYIFIEVLVDKFGYNLKSLCIELYIRGLAMDMNELEHQKVVGDEEKVKETEVRLSYGFQKLADLLKDNIGVSRECLLTAFSLYPTDKTFKKLREMALASGKISSTSQVIVRKRKTRITFRSGEERSCKSAHRKKLKVMENELSAPLTSNRPAKKGPSEVFSGSVSKEKCMVTVAPRKASSVLSLSGNGIDVMRKNSDSESQFSSQMGIVGGINVSAKCSGDAYVELQKLANQTDSFLSTNVACANRHSRDNNNLNIDRRSSLPSGISSSVDVLSVNLRSRSGVLNLADDNMAMDVASPVDVHSHKRFRSGCVDNGSPLPEVSEKVVYYRSRFRSGDDNVCPLNSCFPLSTMARNVTKTVNGAKCYCECCNGRKYSSQSGFRRRSYSEGSLYETSGAKEIHLNKNVNCNKFCRNVRDSALERLKMFERNSSDNWPSDSLLSPPYSVHSSKSSIFDSFEATRNGNYNSRLRSRRGIFASVESFFKEAKPRLVRSYSQPKDVSVMADSVELDRCKSLVSLDIDHRVDVKLHNCKHQDKCKAVHVSDGHNVLHSTMSGKPSTDQENYYVSNVNDLICKVCNHPHKDDEKPNDSRSSLISSTEIIGKENTMELPCQLTGSNCASLKYDVLSAPNEVLDAEKLGLTSQLCDDLAVVLSSPRWHMLSWVLDWAQLSSICERYLQDREGMRNITKELKYLNIDYNQFKDRPYAVDTRDEYCGIEKGYEQWADIGSEHSGSEFSYSSSHKKLKAVEYHDDTDSDSSGISQGHKISLNSPCSSQSDTDLKDKTASKNSFISLSVSDSDTGTQDSRTESLGSDGCCQEKHRRKVPECRRKKMPLVKRIAEKRLNDLSKIRIIVKEDMCKSNHDSIEMTGNAKEVMTIFSDLDENEKKTSAKQCTHSSCCSTVSILNTPERRDKDSKTLKSLRMFRPNHLKSIQDRICFSSAKESSKLKAKASDEGIKFAPMLSTLNLNPRILLTRADVSSHYLKSKNLTPVIVKNTTLNTPPSTKMNGLSRNSQCLGEKKCYFSSNRKNTFSKTHKKVLKKIDGMRPGFKLIRQAVIESHLLARTVPGLDSLDMMVPPPSEPTVQVIQLPHNPPSTGGTNNSTAVNIPPKVTNSQGVQTSSTTISQKVTSTQGVQTSPVNTPLQKVTVVQGMHMAPPISRTTVGEEPGPSAVPHHPDDHWQQSVLNASASENVVTPNVPSFSSPSSRVEPAYSGVVMETCYLSQANMSSSVSSGTPVTAHIQRVGQPSVGLDGDSILAAQSLRRLHQCPQLMSGTHIPIVKGVSLDIVANLRAEALRNADLADSLSSSVGIQRGVQVTGSLDNQKAHIMSKKDVKTCLAPITSPRIPENRIKNTRVEKVDEDSQTDNVAPNKTECEEEDESGNIVIMEDGVTKLVGPGKKSQFLKVIKSPASQVAMLPKFQQAFGKTIYSSSTPGAIDSSSRTRIPSIQDSNSCTPSASVVTSEKAEPVSSDGSSISKGVQTVNLEESLPSKNSMSVLPTSASPLSDSSKAVSPLLSKTAGSSLPAISVAVSHQVPVLCTVSSIAPTSKQSDSAAVDASTISTTTFSNVITTSRSPVTCQSSAAISESSAPVSQKIPLVTSPLPVSSVCETHQTTQPQITVPMKLSMVSLSTNLSEKELLLRSKMTELLNRALQRNSGAVANCSTVSLSSTVSGVLREKRREGYVSSSSDEVGSDSMESSNDQEEPRISSSENIRCIIQSPRVSRPLIEISVEESTVSSGGSMQNTLRSQHSIAGHAQSVLCSGSSDTSVATPHVSQSADGTNTLMPHNSIHPAVSSTTLEQLREFESVLEQVTNTSQMKERKSVLPQSESESANDLTQQLLLTQTSTPNSGDFENSNTPSTSFSRESFPSSSLTTSPKGGSTFTSQTTSLQANIASSRISSSTPVVVVTTYSQPIASPALSVTSQSSSSPSVTPASTPGKTPPKSSPKSSKTKSMKAAPTSTSKTAPVTKPQQKPQEDEETAQRIYAILDQYAEQLKNSPDLINKPAPRRRSNPPINPIGSSKRKKSTPTKLRLSGHPPVLTESSPGGDDPRTVGSEDSSSGITSLPQLHDSPGIITSNSEETPCHEGSPTLQIRRGLGAESNESRDTGLISRAAETSSILSTSAPSGDVITQEASVMGMGTTGSNTPSSSSTVVTGKSLVVGSATALPLYVPGGVRQVLFPVASGLTASVQGRPVVVTKGSKVIRVHQVTVAGGSPMLAGAVAGAKPLQVTTGTTTVQGALVVRQMCVNKAVVSTPSVSAPQMTPLTMVSATSAVKQLKLPVIQAVASGISSQAITGVTGHTPVVLPSGSHTISATSFLPPNIGGVRTVPLLETNKESVGTSTVEDNLSSSGELKVSPKTELVSSMAELDNEKQILPPSKLDSASEFLCVIKQECPSPVDLSGLKKSCLGCETVPPLPASQPSISNLTSFSSARSVNAVKVEIDSKDTLIKTQTNTFDEKINCDPSYKPPSDKSISETASINSSPSVMNSCFQGTVLVGSASSQVSQRIVKDETMSVMECVDSMTPGESGNCGGSNALVETKADTCPKSDSNQNLMLQSSGMPNESTDVAGRSQGVCSSIAANVIDANRDVPKSVLTALSGRPCVMFQEIQEPLTMQQTSAISPGFSQEKKKLDLSLGGQLLNRVLSREKGEVVMLKEGEKVLLDHPKQVDTLASTIDGGKNSIVDIGASTRNRKTSVSGDTGLSKVIFPGTKSCDERSSEDELEKKINRDLTAANSSEYCFPVKRESNTGETPWRYVPVVKRISVSQGKAVPVDSSLIQSQVESEACLNLPRIADSLPDELKGGESDDGCRTNFSPSIEISHSAVKRRLFSDEVLDYTSYPSAKKNEKMKQRMEKMSRVPDAIEREFRQTRLEIEKELRLQKSLSEECEDLGVDEPSTSDLFPEADLLLDPNPSPTYDQTIPDTSCAQNADSSEPFSSSDFRSIDSSSSAEGVHENALCSKMPNLPEINSVDDIKGSPVFLRRSRKNNARIREKISQGTFSSSDFRSIDSSSSAEGVHENASCSKMPNSPDINSVEDIKESPVFFRRSRKNNPRIRERISQKTFSSSDFRSIDSSSSAEGVHENASCSKMPNSPDINSVEDIERSPVFFRRSRKNNPRIRERISQGTFSSSDYRSINPPSSAGGVHDTASCSKMPNSQEITSVDDIKESPVISRRSRKNNPRIREKISQSPFSNSDFRCIDSPSSDGGVHDIASCSKIPNSPEITSVDDIKESPILLRRSRKSLVRIREKMSQGTFSGSDFRSIDSPSSAGGDQESASCSKMPNSPEMNSVENIKDSAVLLRRSRKTMARIPEKSSQETFSSSDYRSIDSPSSDGEVHGNASCSKIPNLPGMNSVEDMKESPVLLRRSRKNIPRIREQISHGPFSSSDFKSMNMPSSPGVVHESTSCSKMPNLPDITSVEDMKESPVLLRRSRKNIPRIRERISQGTFSSSDVRSIDLPSIAGEIQKSASCSKIPNLPEIISVEEMKESPVLLRRSKKNVPRIRERISQGTFSNSDFRSINLPSSPGVVRESTSCSKMPISPEINSLEDIERSPVFFRGPKKDIPRIRERISQGTSSNSDFRAIDSPSSSGGVHDIASCSKMPNSPEINSVEDTKESPAYTVKSTKNIPRIMEKMPQGTFSSSDFRSLDSPSSDGGVLESASCSKMPNSPEVITVDDIGKSTISRKSRKNLIRIREKISEGTFSSSDFRSIDSPSSALGVHESASCSKIPNSPEVITVEDRQKSPIISRKFRKNIPRVREARKKWIWVRNNHGTLEYRKITEEDEKKKPIIQQAPRVSSSVIGAGSLNGSNTFSQSDVNIISFSSSSGEDSLTHPVEGTTHTTTTTFSSDINYSSPQEDTVTSPLSPHSQGLGVSTAPTAAQKFNITYGKKCQTYGKEYCPRGSKRSRVCRFIDYLCDEGDSRDTCDSWDSSNSIEKESTSESSKCGRMYHGIIKDMGSPSTSLEEDDDGKSNPDFQEAAANHSFSNLIPIHNTKMCQENADEPILEGIDDDNAVLPPSNGIESDDEKHTPRNNSLAKSLRKHVIEKNAKKHMLDKIDLYPRVCLKKWKGKDSITCSRYSLELDSVSAVPTGSKHFTCVERPLLESESSVSSEPSSENSSKTSIEQNATVGHLGLSNSLILGKDGELNLPPECPNASGLVKSSMRRSSLRGHVKKGCPCCNGSPEPKKSRLFKGENYIKKGHSGKPCSKLHTAKKR